MKINHMPVWEQGLLRRAFGMAAAVLLTWSPAGADVLVADYRADFPSGRENARPVSTNNWAYYWSPFTAGSGTLGTFSTVDGDFDLNNGNPRFNLYRSPYYMSVYKGNGLVLPGDGERWYIAEWRATVAGNMSVTGTVQRSNTGTGISDAALYVVKNRSVDPNTMTVFLPMSDGAQKAFSVDLDNVQPGDTISLMVRGITHNWAAEIRLDAKFYLKENVALVASCNNEVYADSASRGWTYWYRVSADPATAVMSGATQLPWDAVNRNYGPTSARRVAGTDSHTQDSVGNGQKVPGVFVPYNDEWVIARWTATAADLPLGGVITVSGAFYRASLGSASNYGTAMLYVRHNGAVNDALSSLIWNDATVDPVSITFRNVKPGDTIDVMVRATPNAWSLNARPVLTFANSPNTGTMITVR